MITGKLTPHKSTITTYSASTYPPHHYMMDDDDGMCADYYCGMPSGRRTYPPPSRRVTGPSTELVTKSLAQLKELNTKTLPDQGFHPGARVCRVNNPKEIGVVQYLSYDPVNAIRFRTDDAVFQPIVVRFPGSANSTGYSYNYEADDLNIVQEEQEANDHAA